jgi:alpha-ketoglutarate-dependent taurine dioxygenase/4-hydroxybenzoate polyprenyltransferase
MNVTSIPLSPFGLRAEFSQGTRLSDLDFDELRKWVDTHRVVQLRGVVPVEAHELAALSRRLGPLQPWPFGAVHELKQAARTENYLYTSHDVPLHWDGAFADRVPHWLVFHCVQAPPQGGGGETVFVDTGTVLARAAPELREAWRRARVRYRTEKKAHYGGTFVSPVVARHPTLGGEIIRYAEPVEDLNPVSVKPLDLADPEAEQLMGSLSQALAAKEAVLAVPWLPGDYVFADNHALLHGRRAFTDGAPRHLRRVNVLDEDRRWWVKLRAAWRVRRPEFFRAELPILLIPALLSVLTAKALVSWPFLEGVALFFLMFNAGDMINCLLDMKVDLHRKTHLAEAVALLGRRSVVIQIIVSVGLALFLAAHLALTLARPWLIPAGVLGVILAHGYTAPPLRLKSRGLLQLGSYVALLFCGPMILVSGLFQPWPPWDVILGSLGFGIMQSGILLVNNAEDLDEDEREGIRTASIVLGPRRAMAVAAGMVVAGALLFAGVCAWRLPLYGSLALLPLLGVMTWNTVWLRALWRRMGPLAEPARRSAIRDQGKYVPRRIEAGAWAAAFGALAVLLLRG